jgi:hypothetical protein
MYDALLLYSETEEDTSRAKAMLDALESRQLKVSVWCLMYLKLKHDKVNGSL